MSSVLLRSTAAVSLPTVASRVLGYIRDVVVANFFGAGVAADAFFVAFRIPNFYRTLFAEGAFSQAFVPVLAEYKTSESPAETRVLIDAVAGRLTVILMLITAVGVLSAPVFIMVFAPGFVAHEEKYRLAVVMLQITFPYLLFISLAALAGGILNTYGRFAVPAFTPVFLNLSLIAAAIWLAPMLADPVVALAWGVLLGGIVQLAFQLPFLRSLGLLPRPRFSRGHAGVSRILKLMGPAIFGVSVSQLNIVIDTVIASFLVTGSVSWLYYSDRLVEFPLGVFGIALATVILPGLSERHAAGLGKEFSSTLNWALGLVAVIGVPAATGLAVLAEPMLCTLFQYGALSVHDVEMAGRSLVAYSFGLIGFTLIKVLAPGFFSRQNTRTPVRIGVIAMLANMAMNLLFVFPLAHAGLALATTLAAFINAGLLYRGLRREGVLQPRAELATLVYKAIIASVFMAVMLTFVVPPLPTWVALGGFDRMIQLVAWIVAGASVYVATMWLMGVRLGHLLR